MNFCNTQIAETRRTGPDPHEFIETGDGCCGCTCYNLCADINYMKMELARLNECIKGSRRNVGGIRMDKDISPLNQLLAGEISLEECTLQLNDLFRLESVKKLVGTMSEHEGLEALTARKDELEQVATYATEIQTIFPPPVMVDPEKLIDYCNRRIKRIDLKIEKELEKMEKEIGRGRYSCQEE